MSPWEMYTKKKRNKEVLNELQLKKQKIELWINVISVKPL